MEQDSFQDAFLLLSFSEEKQYVLQYILHNFESHL